MNIKTIILAASAALLCSCAQTATTDTADIAKAAFDAWVTVNNDGSWEKTPLGSWIISYTPGPQTEPLGSRTDNPYFLANYLITDKAGTISSYSYEQIAKQLGTYKPYYYYGPVPITRVEGYQFAGLEEIFSRLYVGDRVKVVIPDWLLSNKELGSAAEYEKTATSSAATIYDFTVEAAIPSLAEYQEALIRAVMTEPCDTLAEGLYYCREKEGNPEAVISSGNTVEVIYTCRRIDGQVVDTNIDSLARATFGIEKKGASFKPMQVKWADDFKSLALSSGGNLISGFKQALFNMKKGEKGTAYMYCDHAYGSSGSGMAIPAYCPLIFELEIVGDEE